MSNPWLPGLLRQLSKNQMIKVWQYDAQLCEAAKELDKLNKIEQIIDTASINDIVRILNEK